MTRTCVRKSILTRGTLLLGLMLGTLAMPAQTDAAGLLDWLFPGRAERIARRWGRSTEAYRPITAWNGAGYTGANTSYYGGNFAGGTNFGSGAQYPAYGSWNGWGYQSNARYQANYQPTTVYRTQWSPVPVTTYSPVAGGAYQQPSTNYEWQARRVPYTAYQPTAASSGCECSNHAAAAPTTAYYGGTGWQSVTSPTTVGMAAAVATAPVCEGCQVTPQGTTAGYAPSADYSNATAWAPVPGQNAAASAASDWQPVPSSRQRAERPLSNDSAGSSEWQPVERAAPTHAHSHSDADAANTRPRLEDPRARETYYRAIDDVERERDELARERAALRRERKALEDERYNRRDSDTTRRNNEEQFSTRYDERERNSDRYSDWEPYEDRQRSVSRYEDPRFDGRGRADDRYLRRTSPPVAPATAYRPLVQPSEQDRQRSEYYRQRPSDDRNAQRPMLDDGWKYDSGDRRNDAYNWRSSSNERRGYSTKTTPASMPNYVPPRTKETGATPRRVMPLLLRPIPESDDRWNTQKAPKLLGPQDRTATLPRSDRWQAVPSTSTPVAKQVQWRSVSGQ